MDNILDNIGLPYSVLNTQHATSGLFGSADADILVSLKPDHSPPPTTSARCAAACPASSPASPSTSCPRTSSPRSSTSACPLPSTSRSTAPTTPATAASPEYAAATPPGPRPGRSPPPAAQRPRAQHHRRPHQGPAGRLYRARCRCLRAQHPLRLHAAHAAVLPQLRRTA
jgi:hypothetical protein